MFEKGLREEFDAWLENREWTQDEFNMVDKLTEEEKDDIINAVLCDEQLTQEMFNCFEWYLNKCFAIKENK